MGTRWSTAKRKVGQLLDSSQTARGGLHTLLASGRPDAFAAGVIRRALSALTFLTVASVASAQLPPGLDLKAAQSDFDLKTGTLRYIGGARLAYGGALIEADRISYNTRTQVAQAVGHVILTADGRRLVADALDYQIATKSYSVRGLRFGDTLVKLSGDSVVGTPESLTFTNAEVSYGEPGPWAPTVSAREVNYFPKRDRIQVSGARFGLGLLQPLPLPSQELPTDITILSYLTATGGYNSSLGAYASIGARVPINPAVTLGGDLGYYTNRGFMVGPAATYAFGSGDQTAAGELTSGFIHDSGDKLTDVLGRRVPEDRGYIAWEHRQQLAENLTFNAQVNYWSDSEILRDYRPDDFFPVQTPDSFFELVHTSDNTVLSAFSRVQPNSYHLVQERLPEIHFDLLPTPVALGVYQRLQSSVAVLREDHPTTGATLRSDRADVYYALNRPYAPNDWFTVTPVAGGRLTHYERALGGKDNYTRALGELGADADLRLSGLYHVHSEAWGIDGLRHLVTPRLSYRYIPQADKGRAYIPQIDRTVFDTYLQPLSLGARRSIDELEPTNTVRLEIDNLFQTRDKTYGSRDLFAFNLAADLRLDPETNQNDTSALQTELALTPAPWLRFDAFNRYDAHDGRLNEFNTGLTVKDGDLWSLRFSSHYLDKRDDHLGQGIQEFVGDFRYRFNEVYTGSARAHYDARQHRFIEQVYALRQNLGNVWTVRYEAVFYEGRRREASFGFRFALETARF